MAGATYTASVHAAPFTLNRTARLEVVETAPDGTTAVTAGSAELTTSGWRKITVAHMATGTGNAISFRLGSAQLGTNEAVRFDAVEVGVTPPPKPRTLVFGSSAATKTEILTHEADLGRTLTGVRQYRKWNGKLFAADAVWARDTGHTLFVSIRSERTDGTTVPYADVATAQPGSAIYNEILAQAEQIKAFGAKVYITYNHEPEAAEAWSMGDGPEFAAAWRRIIDIYRAAGVTNAEYVWTLTGYAFKRTDSRAAAHYWPGVDYVDHIGADVYNWGTCRGGGSWVSMAAAVEPLRKWATQYPTKGVVLMEYSSVEDAVDPTRKAQWWNEAAALFQQPGYEQFQGVLQWSGRNFTHTYDCSFDYKSSVAATQAMQAMGASPAYQARYLDME